MGEPAARSFDAYHVWLGIPPTEQPPDFYRLLAIPPFESDADVIASAADRQMAYVRTFQTGQHAALSQQLLNQIARAKVQLLNPEKKAAYDEELKKSSAARRMPTFKSRKLPVAQPLEPRPRRSASSVAQAKQPAAKPAQPARPKRYRRWGPILSAVIGGGVVIVGAMVWWMARPGSGSPDSQVAATISKPFPERPAEPEVSRHVVPIPQPPQEEAAKEAASPPLPTPEVKKSETPATPDVPSESASDLPDFSQLASASTAPPDHDSEGPDSKQDSQQDPNEKSTTNAPSPHEKHSVPGQDVQESIQAQLAAVYNPSEAKTPGEKVKLARKYVKIVPSLDDANERFVLLSQAVQLAADAGEATLVLQILDLIGEHFEVDAYQRREAFLAHFAETAKTSERIAALLAASNRAIRQALSAGNQESAMNIAEIGVRVGQRPVGREHRKESLDTRAWTQAMCNRLEEVRLAGLTVQEKPDDEMANGTLARWHCFFNDDWTRGLSYLAKCSDEPLRELAGQDARAASNTDAETCITLGDAWWTLAKGRKGEEHQSLMLRAGYWYQRALDNSASGLKKIRIAKRVEELAETSKAYRRRLAQNSLDIPKDSLWADATP